MLSDRFSKIKVWNLKRFDINFKINVGTFNLEVVNDVGKTRITNTLPFCPKFKLLIKRI